MLVPADALPWFATGPMLLVAILFAAVGLWCWRRGRLLGGLVAGAFASVSAMAAAAPPVAQQVERLVAEAQSRAQAQSGSARRLVETAQDRHRRQLEAARALAKGGPERLVQGFSSLADAGFVERGTTLDGGPGSGGPGVIYVAVSFSMPPADLRRLGRDAQKAGALVVIQGLVRGSFRETATAARQVFDENSLGGVAIDPNVFRAFGVTAVPTFIAAAAPVQPCPRGLECTPQAPPHDRLAGNVTLSEALRILESGDEAGFVAEAAAARLRP